MDLFFGILASEMLIGGEIIPPPEGLALDFSIVANSQYLSLVS